MPRPALRPDGAAGPVTRCADVSGTPASPVGAARQSLVARATGSGAAETLLFEVTELGAPLAIPPALRAESTARRTLAGAALAAAAPYAALTTSARSAAPEGVGLCTELLDLRQLLLVQHGFDPLTMLGLQCFAGSGPLLPEGHELAAADLPCREPGAELGEFRGFTRPALDAFRSERLEGGDLIFRQAQLLT